MTATIEAPVTVLSTVAAKMPTRSGDVRLKVITDDDATMAMAGDIVLRATFTGYEPVVVQRARTGIAFDKDARPYDVPVIECVLSSGWRVVCDPSDLLRVVAHNLPPRVVVPAPEPVYRTDCIRIRDDFGDGQWYRVYIKGPARPDEPMGFAPWSLGGSA
jgi:hypothetical protein